VGVLSSLGHVFEVQRVRNKSQSGGRAEVERRLRFEMLLADICAQFVNVAPPKLDPKIESSQRRICEALG